MLQTPIASDVHSSRKNLSDARREKSNLKISREIKKSTKSRLPCREDKRWVFKINLKLNLNLKNSTPQTTIASDVHSSRKNSSDARRETSNSKISQEIKKLTECRLPCREDKRWVFAFHITRSIENRRPHCLSAFLQRRKQETKET
jgi:hypothetical protein